MEGIFRGIPHVSVYIDDILITGETDEEHLQNLDTVISRLEKEGLRLKLKKCVFMLPKIEYLGNTILSQGLHPSPDKVRAIVVAAPALHNVSQLRSFLGMVNYYGKFLNQLSSLLAPLYHLLQQKTKWHWGTKQQKAFSEVKRLLTSSQVLAHYNPEKELLLSCDASPYGIGAVLAHVNEDGEEKPIAYSSRSLAPAEKKYAQLEEEGLAIVFGVKKFHQYLYGRQFTICSDHRPLQHLFSNTKSIPVMASARIQRWALTLSTYDYTIAYKPGEQNANADLLSRLPLPETVSEVPLPGEMVLLMETLQTAPVTTKQIKQWTARDPVLSRVKKFVEKGWKDTKEDVLKPYASRRDELSVQDGCLLWRSRVVIPAVARDKVQDELHDGHPCRYLQNENLARSEVWWPKIGADLEQKVMKCEKCQVNKKKQPYLRYIPGSGLSNLGRAFTSTMQDQGKLFLYYLVVDAHSKWIEVVTVPSTSSQATIKALKPMFFLSWVWPSKMGVVAKRFK